MAKTSFIFLLALSFTFRGSNRILADDAATANSDNEQVKTGRLVYKKEPRRTLAIYYPDDWEPSDKRSALVIFRCRIPNQREYFRKLGMVIIKPQLAGVNSGQLPNQSLKEIAKLPKPRNQVEDTKSAIRFVRQNAEKLGVDPEKIVATGASGGGDLALQSTINRAFADARDDQSVSPRANALVLYCPAFDGIDIWFVKMEEMLRKTKSDAPSFLPLLDKFIKNTTDEYAMPLDHRAALIARAPSLGKAKGISDDEIKSFQEILMLFNERDWQLLHPVEDALKMSASRILTKDPLPPTLILFGDRDHLYAHQTAFVEKAESLGQKFEMKIYKGGGHSFMMQPAFQEPSTRDVEQFLRKLDCFP
jgi:acetyl esterase/lipase